jgi:hypothetical protein
MRMKTTGMRNGCGAAENGPISRSFLPLRSAGRKVDHCYTFEHFAASLAVIRTTYYYHYKKPSSGLKEETTWS